MISADSQVLGIVDAVKESLSLMPKSKRIRLLFVVLIQIFTAVLDLIGVLLISAVGVLSVQIIQGGSSVTGPLESVVNFMADRGFDLKQTTLILAVVAALFLVVKSIVSGLLARRVLLFLAAQQAQLSSTLLAKLINTSIIEIQQMSSLTTAFAIVQGATTAVVGILGSAAGIISETALLIIFGIALFVIDPLITIGAALFLIGIGLVLYKFLGNWSEEVGITIAKTTVIGNTYVQNTISTFRELRVLDRTGLYVRDIHSLLSSGARAQADSAFIGQIPKFVFDSALIVGAVALAGVLFMTSDATKAVSTLMLFLAAGGRVLPSIMRLQGSIVGIRASAGSSVATYAMAKLLRDAMTQQDDLRTNDELSSELYSRKRDFIPNVKFAGLNFSYPNSGQPALNDISFSIEPGTSLALVGATGAGKSTLADALLGVIDTDEGTVLIGGRHPREAVIRWPGGIAYVPQHVALIEGTVRDNVALALPREIVSDEAVWDALEKAHIAEFLKGQREGLDTFVGERGIRLSGGQRQRLGLARALFTQPQLLVLDEATSSLDAQTEMHISDVIHELHGETTLVVIAHRLATIRDFDQVAYLADGKLLCLGTFNEVRSNVPEFDGQAALLGL